MKNDFENWFWKIILKTDFDFLHTILHSITFTQYIYASQFAEASLHFLIACLLSGETPPCGAEPRIELGPALQQANTLPTKPCLTIWFW